MFKSFKYWSCIILFSVQRFKCKFKKPVADTFHYCYVKLWQYTGIECLIVRPTIPYGGTSIFQSSARYGECRQTPEEPTAPLGAGL